MHDLAYVYQAQKKNVLLTTMGKFSLPELSNFRDEANRRMTKTIMS